MSEYQRVLFRAIDAPVSEKNLEFMRRQSSRAEITPWSFDNEYHYGDFRGNAKEMLRRGYDIHLRFANYGVQRLMIHLPSELPEAVVEAYINREGLDYENDKASGGAILTIQPFIEPPELSDVDLGDLITQFAIVPCESVLERISVARDTRGDSRATSTKFNEQAFRARLAQPVIRFAFSRGALTGYDNRSPPSDESSANLYRAVSSLRERDPAVKERSRFHFPAIEACAAAAKEVRKSRSRPLRPSHPSASRPFRHLEGENDKRDLAITPKSIAMENRLAPPEDR